MKTIVVTPAFCKAELLEQSLANYYEYQKGDFEHWILLNHYPIKKEQNNKKIIELANKYGCKIFDNEFDRGLHEGYNNFLKLNPQPSNTSLLGFDPDSCIEQLSHGFDVALHETMQHGKEAYGLAILALWGIGIDLKHRTHKHRFNKVLIKNNCVLIHESVEMWSVCIHDLDFINLIGGFKQPNKYYGGIEIALHAGFHKYNKCLGYLTEYKENYFRYDASLTDPEYRQWKDAHLKGFVGSFEEWLKINKPELLR